jgi:hypothetical protein
VTNSTLSGNQNGLVFINGGTATLTNSTLASNTSAGLFFNGSATANLTNTLLAKGAGDNCTGSGYTIHDFGHNLDDGGVGSCISPGNGNILVAAGQTGLDPTGLQDHGGPTQTIALTAGSPAVGAGEPNTCATTGPDKVNSKDQRGITRPQGTGCDIGAFELEMYTLTTGIAGTGGGIVTPDSGPQAVGTVVSVAAIPVVGDTFAGWTVDGSPVAGPNPLSVTMNAPHTVIANFAVPAPSPSPTVTLTLSTAGGGSGTATPLGTSPHAKGSPVTLTASPATGSTFAGWSLDGVLVSWKTSVTLTMNTNHTVVATFQPTPTFGDVPAGANYADPVAQLAARGIINGCDKEAVPPLFCPDAPTLRHQMAALIVRAIPGWVDETGLPTFTDNTDDTELMTRVATLQRHNVVRGYQDEVCTSQGKTPACYGPLDTVKYGQVLLFIARAMVAKGYWALQPDDRTIFPDQNGAPGADLNTDQQTLDHRMVVTYVYYVGGPPDVADIHAPFQRSGVAAGGWGDDSSRAWFTRAFWPALVSYFGQDNLP